MKWKTETITLLETQLDDITGQEAGYLLQKLLDDGALDAICIPVLMKKGRPGFLFQVICKNRDRDFFCELLFDETPTLGVRYYAARRRILGRKEKKIRLGHDLLRAKERIWKSTTVIPEFDDLIEVARKKHVPLRHIRKSFK